jgi:hypothetical protein
MPHLGTVFLANLAAGMAGLDARAKLCAGQLEIGTGETRHDPSRRQTNVGAIIAIPDAVDHGSDIFLAETGISAGVARCSTGVTSRNALNADRVVGCWLDRMGLKHFLNVVHDTFNLPPQNRTAN